ncbi:hypothetical protein LTR37_016445 [Vermiconidia calcicola]|uniref:Uncharacterized protein n=1 Tax=Vermiconidia calcicola TaxID=1690605 RepID=A0ACC3MPF3_9PEZI|nr:hypothetical protein LTR37_016445 [Vermiconidia calcicola]
MKQLFEIEVQSIDECKERGSKSDPITATSNYYKIDVPFKKGGTGPKLGELLTASKKCTKESVCRECSHDSLTTERLATLHCASDSFAAQQSRLRYVGKASSKKNALAVYTTSQAYTHDDDTGTLTTVVQVQKHAGYESIRRLEVDVKLRLGAATKDTSIGYIVAWHVNKALKPAIGKRYWITELLGDDERAGLDKTEELRLNINKLYTQAGMPRALVRNYSDDLQHDDLIFVDTITLYQKWRGKSIGPKVVASFHSQIFEIVGYEGEAGSPAAVCILSPAKSGSVTVNNKKSELEVEQALQRQYGKSGYATWIQGDPDEDSVTVMGRTIEDGDI